MRGSRRDFFGWAAAGLAAPFGAHAAPAPDYEKPLFNLAAASKTPVIIESIELLRNRGSYFVRTRSKDGAVGVTITKQVADFVPILLNVVVPAFVGKDARDLEKLIDDVYIANYKMAGQPFWCPVAYVEQSILDLLGRVAKKSAGELMGGVIRKEIPVYLSGSDRVLKAEEEVGIYVQGVAETKAKAVKFKIGGRMSRNRDIYPGRTEKVIELSRKLLGDTMILYADANGSYDSAMGIEIGRKLASLNYQFYEEPCPWEEIEELKRVTDALDMPVAYGEQNSSLYQFDWMMNRGYFDIVQPDVNYCGGLLRACRVARMARAHNMQITPHNTQTDAGAANMVAFASVTPNIGPFMEFPWRRPQRTVSWFTPNLTIDNGVVRVPTGPGLGIEFDPDYLAQAEVLKG